MDLYKPAVMKILTKIILKLITLCAIGFIIVSCLTSFCAARA